LPTCAEGPFVVADVFNQLLVRKKIEAGWWVLGYEILAPIGKYGMGECTARDSRLNRDVAIKVSAAQFSERFAHEVQSSPR
jgi:hypothetical protein